MQSACAADQILAGKGHDDTTRWQPRPRLHALRLGRRPMAGWKAAQSPIHAGRIPGFGESGLHLDWLFTAAPQLNRHRAALSPLPVQHADPGFRPEPILFHQPSPSIPPRLHHPTTSISTSTPPHGQNTQISSTESSFIPQFDVRDGIRHGIQDRGKAARCLF
jgi:hypothetical protein